MGFTKTVEARIFGVTTQVLDSRLPIGESSGGTFTAFVNPLRGTLLWDHCQYTLKGVSVGGGATGGSFTVTIQSDAAVLGFTALPIARATLGPLSPSMVVMDNLHHSHASPIPTHINIDQTVANAGSTQAVRFQCHVVAKQYRGTLGTVGGRCAERVLRGAMINIATISDDTTFAIGTTVSDLGMRRMRLWDNALFWAVQASTVTGTWDVDVVGTINGTTTTIATTGIAGAISAAGDKIALTSQYYGQAINPTQIIVTEVTAGTAQVMSVVGMAKSGRGSMAKS